jgi:transcriptional regulator with XRE-family HTH domain
MLFADFRRERGLTLQQTCGELGLSEKSAGWLSDIETGKRDASPLLAIRIERWSDGQVAAASVCPKLRHDPAPSAPSPDSIVSGAEPEVAQ